MKIYTLEEISIQNGPPKENNKTIVKIKQNNNKIIFLNFGGEREKLLLLFVFSTYLHVFLLKFQAGGLIGCIIKFHIQ